MENNKDIGKAFREKLDQLDKMPSDKLWSTIEKDLPSNKKRKILLFWMFSSVVITSLLLSGLFFWNQSISDTPSKPQITLDTKNSSIDHLNDLENPRDKITPNNQIITTEAKAIKSNENSISKNKYAHNLSNIESDSVKKSTVKTKVVTNQKDQDPIVLKSNEVQSNQRKLNVAQNVNSKKVTSPSTTKASNETRSKTTNHKKTIHTYETERLVKNSKRLVRSTEEYDEYEVIKKYTYIVRKKKTVESGKIATKSKKAVSTQKKKSSNRKKVTSKKQTTPQKPTAISKVEEETKSPPSKNTVTESENIAEVIIKKDSTVIPIVEKKPKVVAKNEIKKEQDSIPTVKAKKQSIILTPYYGPTYYSSFGKGNSVSGNYRNDPKKGLIGTTYGVYIRWMFSDRVGLRTGIGKTRLSYATSIQKKDTLFLDTRNINLNPDLYQFGVEYQFRKDSEVILRQNLDYYEIPLEGYYDISNKKVGLATAFGISYLLLDKNSLTLRSNTVPEYTIGKATNLVDQSFTGNIKLIAYYKLTKSLSFDIMPSFQYQIIGFKENVGSFKPFFLTLKAGLSYKF